MSSLDGKKTLEQLIPEMYAARKNLSDRIAEERAASIRTTDAFNVFNGICKQVDAAMAELKREAPHNTDWHSTTLDEVNARRGHGGEA